MATSSRRSSRYGRDVELTVAGEMSHLRQLSSSSPGTGHGSGAAGRRMRRRRRIQDPTGVAEPREAASDPNFTFGYTRKCMPRY